MWGVCVCGAEDRADRVFDGFLLGVGGGEVFVGFYEVLMNLRGVLWGFLKELL